VTSKQAGGKESVINYLLAVFGGRLGSSLRHTVNTACAKCIGTAFPYGTLIINISGSTVMGLIAGYLAFQGEVHAALPAVPDDRAFWAATPRPRRSRSMPACSMSAAHSAALYALGRWPFRSPVCSPASRWSDI
jgi:hypothetical protein